MNTLYRTYRILPDDTLAKWRDPEILLILAESNDEIAQYIENNQHLTPAYTLF